MAQEGLLLFDVLQTFLTSGLGRAPPFLRPFNLPLARCHLKLKINTMKRPKIQKNYNVGRII